VKPVLAIIAAVAAVFGWLAMRPDEATVAATPSMPAVQAAATAVPVAAGRLPRTSRCRVSFRCRPVPNSPRWTPQRTAASCRTGKAALETFRAKQTP
jgi:hypothetical protein